MNVRQNSGCRRITVKSTRQGWSEHLDQRWPRRAGVDQVKGPVPRLRDRRLLPDGRQQIEGFCSLIHFVFSCRILGMRDRALDLCASSAGHSAAHHRKAGIGAELRARLDQRRSGDRCAIRFTCAQYLPHGAERRLRSSWSVMKPFLISFDTRDRHLASSCSIAVERPSG